MKPSLNVFDVQRTCVHDGPGIRTTVFFAGCNMRCLWCQNPEGLSPNNKALSAQTYGPDDILDIVLRDKDYYASSNGGVTLSGGEPLLQDTAGLATLLEQLKKADISVAVETSLHVPWENVIEVVPYTDLLLVDLKIVGNDELHRECTKRDGGRIRENIKKLSDLDSNVRFRMVMVPGYTDSEANIEATAGLLKSLGYDAIELLRYHSFYEKKAERLGLDYASLNIGPEHSLASLQRGIELFRQHGISVKSTPVSSRRPTSFTDRVRQIHYTIKRAPLAVCMEDALLKTEYYKEYGFKKPYSKGDFRKPAPIHRAKSLAYVLRKKRIKIYPRELLVGNFTAERVGGRVWVEYLGPLAAAQVAFASRRRPVPFKCSLKDAASLLTGALPAWVYHNHMERTNPRLSDLRQLAARTTQWNVGMNFNLIGIGHYIPDHATVLELGTCGLKKQIKELQESRPENNQDFYRGAIIALEGLESFAERYAAELTDLSRKEPDPKRSQELEEMAAICRHVPKYPARTFHEALQSILFVHIGLCLESNENAISFGRLDQILHPFYKRDVEARRITYEKAKELICLFIVKMDELILVNNGDSFPQLFWAFETVSTDQAITFGGVDGEGKDATNDVTYMLLDACELQPRAADPAARVHEGSPPEYLDRLAEIYLEGCPLPQLFNDEVYIESLRKHYPVTLEQARNYSIVGCVEPVASDDHFANTDCANMNLAMPFLQALKGQTHDLWNYEAREQRTQLITSFVKHVARKSKEIKAVKSLVSEKLRGWDLGRGLQNYDPPPDMEELLRRFQERLNCLAKSILLEQQKLEKAHREYLQTPLSSALYKGCRESGKDATEGGTSLNSCGIQALAVTDVADSLHAIDELVFRRRLYSIEDVINAIDKNFAGSFNERIREALLAVPKFGDDSSHEATEWVNRVLEIFNNALDSVGSCSRNGRYSAGYYALNLCGIFGKHTQALPSGRLKGVPFANSLTPHYGMKQADLLSALNSISKVDFVEHAENGATATLTIDSGLFPGEEGVKNLSSIFKTFLEKGGMQLQPNVIDRKILLDAYENPEKYPDLLIRIAGYCEYFNNLSDEMKLDVINRSHYT